MYFYFWFLFRNYPIHLEHLVLLRTLVLKKKYPFELNHDNSLFTISIVSTSGWFFVTLAFFLPWTKIQIWKKKLSGTFWIFFKKKISHNKKNIIFIFAPTTTSFVYICWRDFWLPVDTTGYVNNNKQKREEEEGTNNFDTFWIFLLFFMWNYSTSSISHFIGSVIYQNEMNLNCHLVGTKLDLFGFDFLPIRE